MKIKKLTIKALFVSIFVIFSKFLTFTPYMGYRITFKNIVIYISAIILNMKEVALIACLGELLNQITGEYGVTMTTALWILPYVIVAILSSVFIKKAYKNFLLCFITIVLLNILLTILNTIVIYIDSKIFGYYSEALVFGSFFMKIISGVITAIIYTFIMNPIVEKIKKFL